MRSFFGAGGGGGGSGRRQQRRNSFRRMYAAQDSDARGRRTRGQNDDNGARAAGHAGRDNDAGMEFVEVWNKSTTQIAVCTDLHHKGGGDHARLHAMLRRPSTLSTRMGGQNWIGSRPSTMRANRSHDARRRRQLKMVTARSVRRAGTWNT